MSFALPQIVVLVAMFVAPESRTYSETLGALDFAIERGNRDPEQAIELLEEALDSLARFPLDLVGDQRALESRAAAQLSLARAYLLAGREREALVVIDALILDTQKVAPPVKEYGPTMDTLYKERLAAIAKWGTASVEVTCGVPCSVFVQEQPVSQSSGPLLLGDYRIVIAAVDGSAPPLRAQVLLSEPGQVEHLAYMSGSGARKIDVGDQTQPSAKRRALPRWAEISGLAVGVGLVVTGGVLLAYHGRCPGGLDPVVDQAECSRLYNNLASGISTAAVGGAALLGFGIVLTVDEVRANRSRGNTTMLTWTTRF
jgi:hypothetical protein